MKICKKDYQLWDWHYYYYYYYYLLFLISDAMTSQDNWDH